MDFDLPASQRDHQLPMILNLRGDEDLVDEFNWDADQAMEFLGIKRSRLTQISGKELRVARIRRDRYLRPVYREADVRDYQEWTRATATHQSSSRAIEQAIDSLDDRFSDLFVVLQEKLQQFEDRSSRLLRQQLHRLDSNLQRPLKALHGGREDLEILLERSQEDQQKALQLHRLQIEALQKTQTEVQDIRGLFNSFHQDLRTLIVAQNQLRKECSEIQQAFLQNLLDQQQGTAQQWQDLRAELQRLQAQNEAVLEWQKQQSEKPEIPPSIRRQPFLRHQPCKVPKRWQRAPITI